MRSPVIMAFMQTHIGLNAHLLASGKGYRRAGIHGYIYNLLRHLPQAAPDYRYTVMVGVGDPPADPALQVRRSSINTESPLRRILWEQAIQPMVVKGFDLTHELAFAAPLIMPCPFVVTVYDLSFIRYPERLPRVRRWYLRLFTGLSCRRARRVIAISESTAADLVSLLRIPRSKIDLAIPGVEAHFKPIPRDQVEAWRAAQGLPPRFLLFVGTLEPRKNLEMLVRAYGALPESARIPLVLAGGRGWMNEGLDQAIRDHRLEKWVIQPGFVADSDLVWWYNAAETMVYPSVFEGWGMPVTEAMACGKPALVSDVSSLPEAVGETGMRLPPHDQNSWTEGLRRALEDQHWRLEQGEKARERAASFTWTRTAQQTASVYHRALENRD